MLGDARDVDLAELFQEGHGQEREPLKVPSLLLCRVRAFVVRRAAFGVEQECEVIGECDGGGPSLLPLVSRSGLLRRVVACRADLREASSGKASSRSCAGLLRDRRG